MTKKIGELYMQMDAGDHTNKFGNYTITVARDDLPNTAAEHQDASTLINSGGGDVSSLSPADLPPGISIECTGSTSDGWGWAVVKPYNNFPILSASEFDENYQPLKFQFCLGLYLHCNNQFSGGGNVRVTIYSSND